MCSWASLILARYSNILQHVEVCACIDPCSWIIHIHGSEGTLYEGEEFVLQFKFNSKYPFDSPQVSCFRQHGDV